MKKIIIVLTTLISIFVLLTTTSSCMSEQQKIEAFVKDFNKSCPIVDQNIRVEGAKLQADKTIEIEITTTSKYLENDEFTRNTIKEGMHQVFLQLIQSGGVFKGIKSTNVTFHYVLKTMDGEPFTDFKITPEEYNAPQTGNNSITGTGIHNNVEAMLNIMVTAVKNQLPIVDEETGIKTVDCYADGKTMVTVAVIPDETIGEYLDQEEFVSTVRENMKELARGSMRESMKYGISIRYIYKKENGDIYADITISKDDL